MAFSYSPKIVTDGLVLYLDAGNPYSYVSGSTNWNDLSRSQTNGTLVNGPTYSSANGGSIVFDGVDDYVAESNFFSLITNSFTITSWLNFTNPSFPLYQKIIHTQVGVTTPEVNLDNYNGGSGNPKYHFYTAAGGSSNNILTSSMDIPTNTWAHIVGVYDDATKTKYLYVNGTVNNSGSTTVQISWPNNVTWIGRRLTGAEPMNGRIATTQIYNRALSAQEVLQNYNATKTRFGL